MENNLVIARLDKLSRNEDIQEKLKARDCRWDLIVCDEAHKMSATFFGGEIKSVFIYISVRDDLILDPFLGTGTTTTIASMVSARNSIGFQIDDTLEATIAAEIERDLISARGKVIPAGFSPGTK